MTVYTEKPKRSMIMDASLAGIWPRLVALIIDNLILALIAGAGWFGSRSGAGAGLGFLIGLAYQWFMLTRNNGQTIGKMVMNIRVVKTNGMPLTAGDVIVRYIGYYINTALYGLGWFWAAFDGQRQGWHDKLAGTVVVRAS